MGSHCTSSQVCLVAAMSSRRQALAAMAALHCQWWTWSTTHNSVQQMGLQTGVTMGLRQMLTCFCQIW
jgi:hypothetical protein